MELSFRAWYEDSKSMTPLHHMLWLSDNHTVIMRGLNISDSNNNDIYEGDIVKDHIGVGVVEYNEQYAYFRVNYKITT